MLLSDESDTALPQKDRFSIRSWGQPRARTSVAVSERAQQNDCAWSIESVYANTMKQKLIGSIHQVKISKPLGCVRQIHNGVVR